MRFGLSQSVLVIKGKETGVTIEGKTLKGRKRESGVGKNSKRRILFFGDRSQRRTHDY